MAENVKTLPGVTLVNVDDLAKIKDDTLQMRRNEVPKAMEIIHEHIAEFNEWYAMRRHVPVLKEVKSKLKGMYVNELLVCNDIAHPQLEQDQAIQSVINILAAKMRRKNAPGCHYIEAINDFIAHHG